MVYEKKALGAIDKILDAIVYEEGRLSVINKYGTALNDEEKVQATQLITAQRENLDRLFEIYKNDLEPVMAKIDATGHSMQPFVEKLLAAEMIAKRMIFDQEVAAAKENNAAVSNDTPVITGTVPNEETAVVEESSAGTFIPAETAVANDTPGVEATGDAVVTESTPVETPVAEMTGETAVVSAAPTAEVTNDVVAESASTETPVAEMTGEAAVVSAAPAVEESNDVVAESASTETAVAAMAGEGAVVSDAPAVEVSNDVVTDSTTTETPVSEEGAVVNAAPAESASSAFVLSPIDEDVAPAASAEEVKAAEETVAAADQQLQTIDNMKTDITSDPNLTEEEKKDKLEQYTRMTDATVRAILVTKVQAEKLLASRESQKALLTKGNEAKAEEATDAAIPAVSGEADAPATEEAKTEDVDPSAVVLPTIGATDTSSESAAPAVTEDASASEVVLPMIGGDAAPSESAAPVEQTASADENALSNVVLEIPGAAPAEQAAPADAQNNNSELQTMIEQANALYKEGKVDEAKAMFEKIGAMNQAGQGAGEAEAANVLVKK